MQETVRPEITNIINQLQVTIAGFDAFKNNFDDQHYDMYKEGITMFSGFLDQLASMNGFNKAEKNVLKPFLKAYCLPACETLRNYIDGRKMFLKVDFDIARAAESVANTQNQAVSAVTQQVNNLNESLVDKQQAEIIPIGQDDNTNSENKSMDGPTRSLSTLPKTHKPSPFSIPA